MKIPSLVLSVVAIAAGGCGRAAAPKAQKLEPAIDSPKSEPRPAPQKVDPVVDAPTVELSLGQGYDPVSGLYANHCVELGELRTQSGSLQNHGRSYRTVEIKSLNELESALGVAASDSLYSHMNRRQGRFEFAKKIKKNLQKKYLMVQVRTENSLEIASSFAFTERIQKILAEGMSADQFRAECGTEFVHARRTGAEIFAIFEFDFDSRGESEAFSAALKDSGSHWKDADFSQDESSFFVNFRHRGVEVLKIGGGDRAVNTNSVNAFIRDVAESAVDLQNKPVVLEWVSKDYEGVEPFILARPRFPNAKKQKNNLRNIVGQRNEAIEYINTAEYASARAAQNAGDSAQQTPVVAARLQDFIRSLDKLAISCVADDTNQCVVPGVETVAQPVIENGRVNVR